MSLGEWADQIAAVAVGGALIYFVVLGFGKPGTFRSVVGGLGCLVFGVGMLIVMMLAFMALERT